MKKFLLSIALLAQVPISGYSQERCLVSVASDIARPQLGVKLLKYAAENNVNLRWETGVVATQVGNSVYTSDQTSRIPQYQIAVEYVPTEYATELWVTLKDQEQNTLDQKMAGRILDNSWNIYEMNERFKGLRFSAIKSLTKKAIQLCGAHHP